MRILKWLGIVFGGLFLLLIVFITFIYISSNSKLNAVESEEKFPVEIKTDSLSLAAGEHLAITRGCTDCHGPQLAGGIIMDNPAMGTIVAPNLTEGKGGIGGKLTTELWERAIRQGIGFDGRPLLIMPSDDYYYMTKNDLSNLLSYIKSVPPVDNELPELSPGPVMRMLLTFGEVETMPARIRQLKHKRQEEFVEGVNPGFGRYLSTNCISCHRQDMSGGKIKGGDPSWPPAANLTPHMEQGLGGWQKADFVKALREGKSTNGRELHPAMPRTFGYFTDEEIEALWLYLRSIPAIESEKE